MNCPLVGHVDVDIGCKECLTKLVRSGTQCKCESRENANRNDCYRPQTKLRKGYVFTGVCDSVHRGRVSKHALQVVSQHTLQVSGGGECIPTCLAGFQAHTQGELECLARGVSRPTPGGVSRTTPGGVSRYTPRVVYPSMH